jgi:hypothetical protein
MGVWQGVAMESLTFYVSRISLVCSTAFRRATPKMAVQPFHGWSAHRVGGLWSSSSLLDTPRLMPMSRTAGRHEGGTSFLTAGVPNLLETTFLFSNQSRSTMNCIYYKLTIKINNLFKGDLRAASKCPGPGDHLVGAFGAPCFAGFRLMRTHVIINNKKFDKDFRDVIVS